MIGRDGVAGLLCLAGALLLLWTSRTIPAPPLVPIGPAFYPRILLGITAVLALALIVNDLRGRQQRPPRVDVRYRFVVLTFLIFIGYVVLLPLLGYRVATGVFVAILHAALDPPRSARAWALVLGGAVVTTVITYVVFERYLSVLLPRGRWTGF
jgi:hypothetical protein